MWLRGALYWGYQYKRTWRSSIFTSFLIPVLYLTSMGVALGSLIDKHSHGVDGVTYVAYLAPGLLAATCMQIGANDTMWPVMGAIKWTRVYLAMLAAPLSIYDVLLGHLTWVAARIAIVVSIYLAVMAAFGTIYSPVRHSGPAGRCPDRDGLRCADGCLLGHAGQGQLVLDVVSLRDNPPVPLLRHLLPDLAVAPVLQFLAYVTPLYHGVALCRDLTLGHVDGWVDLGHAAYLSLWVGVGYCLCRRTFARRLVV